jgi:hypothetical protein
MKFKLINVERTQSDSRLRYTADVQVDDWMIWKNVCVFVRPDGTAFVRPPVRQIHGPKKTIYEELIVIESPIIQRQFQTEVLNQIDMAMKQ